MKILFVIDQVYLHGGIERVLSIKANYFAAQDDNEIHIITTEQKDNKPCYDFSTKISFQDIGVNYNRTKSYFHPINLLKLPKHVSKIRSAIKNIQPDVVVVCSHSTDTYFMPFVVKSVPKVKEFHFSKFIEEQPRKNPRNILKKYFFKFTDFVEKKYDKLIILNNNESGYYKTDNTVVIPNPLTFYPDSVSELKDKIVISAGRIAPVKGFDILIDIWELVHQKNKDWELHIYGDGDQGYVEMLQDKINQKGLQHNLILKGSTDNVKSKMLSSSIYAMSSHNECFPLVLLEAQSCGLPIISFDCPHGPRSIINEENGCLVELYHKEEFSEKLLALMSNPEQLKAFGANARENASNFEVKKVMDMWQDMFNSLIFKNVQP
ncbi:glycosyltransferase family 4 protein [Aquimarina sp. 2201CG14-23]|uniref:glycosyltransferase family 4 protein n=1 Tax=Aquimarina mycalae TaxID=3040073 RepID=UPI002477DD01|nr:glycosyltransferase family 4 protein [Aquimarina sp. 2201CG14-23]MDH7446581.1 glycosyltransferase family 4 protein [Aquimarina sp. 2201CG14-23]